MSTPRVRVAVVTGASSGIGLATAKALASQGFRIIGTGRDAERTRNAEAEIRAATSPGIRVDMIRVDLSVLAEVSNLAKQIATLTDRIDVLLNNAGGTAKARKITVEGNEATFAGNHLGHFALTQMLLPLLRHAATTAPRGATRVINVASAAHEAAPGLKWNDLQMIENFVPMPAYCNAKLANILFTRELAARLASQGIVVNAMHPGIVNSNFASHADEGTQRYFSARNDLATPEDAADTLIWLASAPEAGESTGAYFHRRKPVAPSAAATDASAAQKLWEESEKLVARALG